MCYDRRRKTGKEYCYAKGKDRKKDHRREPQGETRLFCRGYLRSRDRALRDGGQERAARAGESEGLLLPRAGRGVVCDRGAHLALRKGEHFQPRSDAGQEAPDAQEGDSEIAAVHHAGQLHTRAALAVLLRLEREDGGRALQGQEALGQA